MSSSTGDKRAQDSSQQGETPSSESVSAAEARRQTALFFAGVLLILFSPAWVPWLWSRLVGGGPSFFTSQAIAIGFGEIAVVTACIWWRMRWVSFVVLGSTLLSNSQVVRETCESLLVLLCLVWLAASKRNGGTAGWRRGRLVTAGAGVVGAFALAAVLSLNWHFTVVGGIECVLMLGFAWHQSAANGDTEDEMSGTIRPLLTGIVGFWASFIMVMLLDILMKPMSITPTGGSSAPSYVTPAR